MDATWKRMQIPILNQARMCEGEQTNYPAILFICRILCSDAKDIEDIFSTQIQFRFS